MLLIVKCCISGLCCLGARGPKSADKFFDRGKERDKRRLSLFFQQRKRRNSWVVVVSLRTGIRGFAGLPTFWRWTTCLVGTLLRRLLRLEWRTTDQCVLARLVLGFNTSIWFRACNLLLLPRECLSFGSYRLLHQMGRRRKICNRISILTHSRLQVVIPYLKILNWSAIPSCLRSIRMGLRILCLPLSLFLTQRIRLLIIWRLTWGVIKGLCSVKDEVSIKLLWESFILKN